tara:strand:- start:6259 stop:7206 length:948 start_codon:yes stop_codon:yes gene_type:complete
MANLTTSADILDFAQDFLGEATDGSSDYDAETIVFLNEIHHEILDDEKMLLPSAKKDPPGSLFLEPEITTGTVAVTVDSKTATFSATPAPAQDSDVTGWWLKIDGEPEVYYVSSIAAAVGTLNEFYVGDTDATATYTLFKLDYTLASDFKDMVSPMVVFGSQSGQGTDAEVEGLGEDVFRKKFPLKLIESGVPTHYTFIGDQKIRFNKYVTTREMVLYPYIIEATDLTDGSGTPLIPRTERRVMAWGVAMLLAGLMNDSSVNLASQVYTRGLEKMRRKYDRNLMLQSAHFGKAIIRPDRVAGRGLLRTESGMIIG